MPGKNVYRRRFELLHALEGPVLLRARRLPRPARAAHSSGIPNSLSARFPNRPAKKITYGRHRRVCGGEESALAQTPRPSNRREENGPTRGENPRGSSDKRSNEKAANNGRESTVKKERASIHHGVFLEAAHRCGSKFQRFTKFSLPARLMDDRPAVSTRAHCSVLIIHLRVRNEPAAPVPAAGLYGRNATPIVGRSNFKQSPMCRAIFCRSHVNLPRNACESHRQSKQAPWHAAKGADSRRVCP